MTRGIRLAAFLGLAFAAALLVFLSSEDSARAQPPFNPGGIVCLENFFTPAECDGDPSPGASADIRTRFCIGWNDDCTQKDSPVVDSNFGAVVSFTPRSFTVPRGSDVPVGALVGRLTSEATLGLLNSPCDKTINVAFTMMNASIDINDTIDPKPVGEADVMEPHARDANGNGIPDGADKYPSFLNTIFDNAQPHARLFGISRIQNQWVELNFVIFEPGATLTVAGNQVKFDPARGYPSVTILQDPTVPPAQSSISDFCAPLLSATVTLGTTLNNPCNNNPTGIASCPGTTPIFENRGYPLFPCEVGSSNNDDPADDNKVNDGCPQVGAVSEASIPGACDNAVSDDPEDSDVNDGCPQAGSISEAGRIPGGCSGNDEGGCVYRANASDAGTHSFMTLSGSQRDADGDGIENSLDVCSLVANGAWNPRGIDLTNDPDQDGLPNECDPNPDTPSPGSPPGCPAGFTGFDEDLDCFSNRQDNCPTDNQLQNPNEPAGPNNKPNPVDSDGDGIGDACDPDPDVPNGENIFFCVNFDVQVGAGASTAPAAPRLEDGPDCALAPDAPPPTGPTPVPAPTGGPGAGQQTPAPTGGGGIGGPGPTGIGTLSPVASSIPAWAAIISALGGAGLLSGLGVIISRLRRRG